VADRDGVAFDALGAQVDVQSVRQAMASGLESLSTEALVDLAGAFGGELLAGLELPDFHDFQAWCVAEREQMRRQHVQVLRALVYRLGAEAALPHARALVQVEPLDEEARIDLVRLLVNLGRVAEAEQYVKAGAHLFRDLGARRGERLAEAWAAVRHTAPPAASSSPQPAPTASPPPPAEVDRTRGLVGRQAPWRRLTEQLRDRTASGDTRVLLVTGTAGAGKTRLLAELAAEARRRSATVLEGAAYEAELGRPFGPWIDALSALAPEGPEPSPEHALSHLLPRSGEAHLAGGSREELFGAVRAWMDARARAAPPMVLLLDDAHWLDEASASLLHYIARAKGRMPLLVVLGARSGELPDNAAMRRTLRSVQRAGRLEELELEPLDSAETAELARRVRPDVDVERVYADSGGNPLLAIELARSAPDRATGVSPSLRDLVRERLERVPQEAADVLRWCAVLGPSFVVRRLRELTTMQLAELIAALEVLERHGLLAAVRNPAGSSDAYAFTHDVVRRAVYADISEPRRRLMHARAAEALERRAGTEDVVTDLARHASLAGAPGMAAAACVAAGRRCLRVFASDEAHALARRGMRYADDLAEPERVQRLLELHEVALAARRPAAVDEVAARLEALSEQALDLGCADHARLGFHLLSHLRWERGEWTEAHRQSMRAAVVGRAADASGRVVALAQAAQCLTLLERDLGQAEALVLEARALAERGSPEPPTLDDAAGMLHMHRGDCDAARESFLRARDRARSQGDHRAEFIALEHLTRLEVQRLAYAEAEVCSRELAALAHKLQDGSEACFAQALLSLCAHALGRPGAPDALDAALGELRNADAKLRLAYILNRRAQVELARDDALAARRHAAEAFGAATAIDRPSEAALARVLIGRAAEVQADAKGAGAEARALRRLPIDGMSAEAREAAQAWLASRPAPQRHSTVPAG
jgi:hypothetical protein